MSPLGNAHVTLAVSPECVEWTLKGCVEEADKESMGTGFMETSV